MIVYVVINEQVVEGKIVVNIIGVYNTHEEAMEQYTAYVDNGRYGIYPVIMGQTTMNLTITEYNK